MWLQLSLSVSKSFIILYYSFPYIGSFTLYSKVICTMYNALDSQTYYIFRFFPTCGLVHFLKWKGYFFIKWFFNGIFQLYYLLFTYYSTLIIPIINYKRISLLAILLNFFVDVFSSYIVIYTKMFSCDRLLIIIIKYTNFCKPYLFKLQVFDVFS